MIEQDIERKLREALAILNIDFAHVEVHFAHQVANKMVDQIQRTAQRLAQLASEIHYAEKLTIEDFSSVYRITPAMCDYTGFEANYFYFWAFETPWVVRVWLKTLTGYLLVSMEVLLRVVISKAPSPRHPKHAGFLSFEDGTLNILIEV